MAFRSLSHSYFTRDPRGVSTSTSSESSSAMPVSYPSRPRRCALFEPHDAITHEHAADRRPRPNVHDLHGAGRLHMGADPRLGLALHSDSLPSRNWTRA